MMYSLFPLEGFPFRFREMFPLFGGNLGYVGHIPQLLVSKPAVEYNCIVNDIHTQMKYTLVIRQ